MDGGVASFFFQSKCFFRPFESHFTLRNKNKGTLSKVPLFSLAETVGFEPTDG